ncbi:excisionase family DNA-binding protein [Noviherbaspirillum aridicola]|uniref:Response regulatory domain-containing protein n=1 Tax=Noviherbaspirillum aridicola TaxID=2849687 RepID=A0ABQ4Q6N1_9BURK|nr:excisionase family DNA-binding protein [Noviherbaspirillum aridicola]GIZ52803.1 hypothetical protein NCCP691_28170 [Noviherbaspirillum aridicola]
MDKQPTTGEVCTTQEVARLLGISVTSVQQLVEAGVIEAWKTKGGHRRIPLRAVHAYRASTGAAPPAGPAPRQPGDRVSVLVVEDNEMQRAAYEKKFAAWKLPLDVRFCENGYQALVEIAARTPDVLLADIVMSGIDGYEVINTILGYPNLSDMHIAVVSGLSEADLAARGGLPPGVVFFGKPVNYDELRGYMRACCAAAARRARPR